MHLIEESPDVMAVGYDPELRELHVRYRDESGDTWVYHDVGQRIFEDLMLADAGSKGRVLDALVEGRYRATKLED